MWKIWGCTGHVTLLERGVHRWSKLPRFLLRAEDIEDKVIHEIIQTIRSPEILTNITQLADEHAEISKQNIILALKNLNEVWAYLYPTEQQKIVSMLTDEVIVGDEGIRIAMNLQGFDSVMVELTI